MSYDNNIKNFTAADIEKYHKGLLSSKERHALEKAALDDPFLADALEGYAAVETGIAGDIEELKKRLAPETGKTRVIPMYAGGKSSFPWLRVAVLVILIAGAGLLSYQFLFKSQSDDIAKVESKKDQSVKTKDSSALSPQFNKQDSSSGYALKTTGPGKTITNDPVADENVVKGADQIFNLTIDSANRDYKPDDNPAPARVNIDKEEIKKRGEEALAESGQVRADTARFYNEVAVTAVPKDKPSEKEKDINRKPLLADDAQGLFSKNENAVAAKQRNANAAKEGLNYYSKSNIFRGTVTDANGSALPFANITNTRDNVGTYTDARGNFTLISPADSVLNVQVKVVGFESNNVALRNSVTDNQIMMREDRSLTAKILDTVKRDYARRSREAVMTFEEPVPTAGWEYYGSYLVNNLNVPDNYVMKNTEENSQSMVEVSFEVNKNGDPVNIRVEKSLCDKCDKEAIRLIKEGPKFKGRTKKGKRTTVKVPFIKPE